MDDMMRSKFWPKISLAINLINASLSFDLSRPISCSRQQLQTAAFENHAQKQKRESPLSMVANNDEATMGIQEQIVFLSVEDMEIASDFPPPPCPKSDPNDNFWRSVRQTAPLVFQNAVRDSGFGRFVTDTLAFVAVRSMISTYKQTLPVFMKLSNIPTWIQSTILLAFNSSNVSGNQYGAGRPNTFRSIKYGSHSMQVMHLMCPLAEEDQSMTLEVQQQLVLFVHGGGWGSGRPWMYRLVARPFLEQGISVAVLGYRTYPTAKVQGQVKDIQTAIATLLEQFPGFRDGGVSVIGHSSGAHVGLLSILDASFLRKVNVDSFIGLSGVYNIPKHYEHESGRGVDELSPMKPACGSFIDDWVENSPTFIIDEFIKNNGQNTLPRMLLVHGAQDNIVPYTSTLEFSKAMFDTVDCTKKVEQFQTVIFPTSNHVEPLIEIMIGGSTEKLVVEWLSKSNEREEAEKNVGNEM